MVINVKKTFCAFRALCALKPICQRSCRKDTTKKIAIVSLRPFLSIFVSLRTKIIWKSQKKSVSLHR